MSDTVAIALITALSGLLTVIIKEWFDYKDLQKKQKEDEK